MLKFKKVLIPILIIFAITLAGCGSGTTTPTDRSDQTSTPISNDYSNSDFTITKPADWEIIDKSSFPSNVPEEVVVSFRNNIRNEIFTTNTSIIKRDLQSEVTIQDFAKSAMETSKNNLIQYKELSTENREVKKGKNNLAAILVEFEGKRNAQDPLVRFKQFYVVDGKTAFMVTAGYLPVEDPTVVKKIDDMLNSFSLK